jgi:hypothetical protein
VGAGKYGRADFWRRAHDGGLDTGALIGFERNDRRVVGIVARALEHHDPLLVAAGVVAETRRDGSRQTRPARPLGASAVRSNRP